MLTLLLSVVVRTTAGPVTADAALKKAKAFMAARNAGKSEGLALAKDNKRRSVKGNETEADTYYYIFNNEQQGGFVIVSADDATEQILAYSDDGYFDVNDIPEGVQELLDGYQKEIRYVRINELIPDDPTPVLEDETAKQAIAPYLSTLWGQGKPYNQECFTQEGDTAVTGCVATAMAQIMYYHNTGVWHAEDAARRPLQLAADEGLLRYRCLLRREVRGGTPHALLRSGGGDGVRSEVIGSHHGQCRECHEGPLRLWQFHRLCQQDVL